MRVIIVGTGYVGLVTGACLAEIGHRVVCVDRRPDRIAAIRDGRPPFYEPGLDGLLREVLAAGRLDAADSVAAAGVADADVIMLAVGTPFGGAAIDLSQIEAASDEIGAALRGIERPQVVVVKSTVVPGTTETVVGPRLAAASGRRIGDGLGLCMNPEFLREGTAVEDFRRSDRVVLGGTDSLARAMMVALYAPMNCPVVMTTPGNAELIKYTSNALLATLISFSNEIASLCEAVPGLDIEQVMDAVHLDRRLAILDRGRVVQPSIVAYLRASSGFGGSCLPKDVNALRAHAARLGVATPLLDGVMAVNQTRPAKVAALVRHAMGGDPAGRRVAVLGLAFKADTDDVRDSPAIALVQELLAAGACVVAHDPVAADSARLVLGDRIAYADTLPAALSAADAAVIATAWPGFRDLDWAELATAMTTPLLVDARNALRGVRLPESVRYVAIGRCLS